jgi:hypothetical protein
MQIFKNYDEVLSSVITAFCYNRDEEYLVKVLEQVKRRINGGEWEQPLDEADIIASILYDLYGDYGTSPRYGWFYNSLLIDEFNKILDNEIEELKEYIEEKKRDDKSQR